MHRRHRFAPLGIVGLTSALAFAVAGCGGIGGFGGMGANTTTITIGSPPYTDGSGTIVTRTRELGAFHAISVENGLTVIVARGDTPSAKVEADDNIVDLISTQVADGRLTVKVTGGLRTHFMLKVTVTAAGTLDTLATGGGSTFDIESIDGPATSVTVTGGSTFRGGGKTQSLTLTADGGSTADLRNVESETATLDVNGGSTAHVRATKSIGGTCHGGSTTNVYGSPATNTIDKDAGSTVRSL